MLTPMYSNSKVSCFYEHYDYQFNKKDNNILMKNVKFNCTHFCCQWSQNISTCQERLMALETCVVSLDNISVSVSNYHSQTIVISLVYISWLLDSFAEILLLCAGGCIYI